MYAPTVGLNCAGLPRSMKLTCAAMLRLPHRTLFSNTLTIRTLKLPSPRDSWTIKRSGDWLTLNFPAWSTEVVENPPALLFSALGIPDAKEVRVGRDYLVVLESQQQVEALTPDIGAMIPLDKMVCVTAPGEKYDFVSRFFCPGEGVPEDPVTGSAHSMLIPYWSEKLGKTSLYAHQGAHRGGDLRCEMKGDRVLIGGQATLYLKGKIFLR